MNQKLRLFVIHQTVTSPELTNNLNLRTRWYLTLDESNRMKSAYFTIRPGKILLLKMVAGWNPLFLKSTGFTSSTFPIQPDFSQNQPATITLVNTGVPRTLLLNEIELILESGTPKANKVLNYKRVPYYFSIFMDHCWPIMRCRLWTKTSRYGNLYLFSFSFT